MKKLKTIFGVLLISLLMGCQSEKQQLAEALGAEIPESIDHLTCESKDEAIRITCSIDSTELKGILEDNDFQREPGLDQVIDFGITDNCAFRGVKIFPLGQTQAYSKGKTKLWVNSDQTRIYLIYKK